MLVTHAFLCNIAALGRGGRLAFPHFRAASACLQLMQTYVAMEARKVTAFRAPTKKDAQIRRRIVPVLCVLYHLREEEGKCGKGNLALGPGRSILVGFRREVHCYERTSAWLTPRAHSKR